MGNNCIFKTLLSDTASIFAHTVYSAFSIMKPKSEKPSWVVHFVLKCYFIIWNYGILDFHNNLKRGERVIYKTILSAHNKLGDRMEKGQ